MSHTIQSLTDMLGTELHHLGVGGGRISPSVYDTAQTLVHTADHETAESIVAWLLTQQAPDGGWGNSLMPRTRTTPTLAALLALHQRDAAGCAAAIAGGVTFLQQQANVWTKVPDDIPVAAELLIPTLAATAQADGLAVPQAAYARLAALGEQRRALLTRRTPRAASPLAHSWEAWGTTPDPALLDGAGSIGHNPAATAAWLRMAGGCPDLADHRARGQQYLADAATTCDHAGPGMVPGLWPAPRNEQILALYHLQLFGLLDHPALRAAVEPQVAALWHARRATGFGLSDWFHTDGDLTAMGFAVLTACGYTPDLAVLRAYLAADGRSCLSYPDELQRSRSTTAHAAHTFALLGDHPAMDALLDYVLASRDADHRLIGDKWHATWLYMNSHMVAMLCQTGQVEHALRLLAPVLADQHADGGWGIGPSTGEETAYAVLALHALRQVGVQSECMRQAVCGAARYLHHHTDQAMLWYDKEIYRPYRVVRVIELAAMVVCQQEYV